MTASATAPIVPVLKRRLRALTYLAGVTAFAVLLAIVTIWQRASTGEPEFKTVRMFPSLAARVDDVVTIQVETKAAAFNVSRTNTGDWILPDKANYRADFNTVRKAILGLSELDLVETRSARADWQERLGLGLPKSGGSGTLVTLKDKKGEVLASLIAGTSVEGASAGEKQAIYVRRPTQDQTFVARGNFAVPTDQAQWLSKTFIDFTRGRVKTVTMTPLKGKPYTVTRAKPTDENFTIVDKIPPGRVLRTEQEPNGIGNALLGLSFDDVAQQTKVEFTGAARVSFVTFDGLTLDLALVEKDRDFWMTVNAVGNPQAAAPSTNKLKPDVVKEAKDINATVGGWAYKVPRYKGALLTAPMEDLLKPVGEPAAPPSP